MTTATADALVDSLLSRIDAADRDRAVPLLGGELAALAQRMTGRRPHRSWFHRAAADGTAGVRLAVLAVGRERMTTARALAQHFVAVGSARQDRSAMPRLVGRRRRGGRR